MKKSKTIELRKVELAGLAAVVDKFNMAQKALNVATQDKDMILAEIFQTYGVPRTANMSGDPQNPGKFTLTYDEPEAPKVIEEPKPQGDCQA